MNKSKTTFRNISEGCFAFIIAVSKLNSIIKRPLTQGRGINSLDISAAGKNNILAGIIGVLITETKSLDTRVEDKSRNHPTMNKPISFRSIWPFILASLTLVLGPLFVAWQLTPADYVFSGTLANNNDFSAYLAAMRQGANGNWLFHFTFSPESWRPQLMFPMYMLMGKVAPPILDYVAWLNIVRVIALVLTLLMFSAWVEQIFPENPTEQWTAWLLLVFGNGLGWLLWPMAKVFGFSDSATLFPDISDSSWGLGLIGANAPHYMIGLFLETLFFLGFWQVTREAGRKWIWITTIAGAALGLTYVYNTTVLFATIGLYLIWTIWKERRIPWEKWPTYGLILFPIVAQLFYYGYWLNRDPAWAQYAVNTPVPPPPWYALIWGTGIVGCLAMLGVYRWGTKKQDPLLIFWIAGNLVVMYVPFVRLSGRFLLGLWVPLATLAAYGLEEVALPWLKTRAWYSQFSRFTLTPQETLRRLILILTMPSGLIVALFFIKSVSIQQDFPFYMPKNEIRAMSWLAMQSDPKTDLVLAYYPVGNYFPALSDTRVFMGQFSMTVNFKEKRRQVEQFWQADTPDSWRQALLKEWGITYIYQGRYENILHHGGFTLPGKTVVYDQAGVKIYRAFP